MTACGSKNQQGQTNADSSAAGITEKNGVKKDNQSKENTDVLVAHFFCTGTTKPLTEYLKADLYEIEAKTPYTSARPPISGKAEDMGKYHTVVLAYPKMEYGISLCI